MAGTLPASQNEKQVVVDAIISEIIASTDDSPDKPKSPMKQAVNNLALLITDTKLPISEKVSVIQQIQTALLIPQLEAMQDSNILDIAAERKAAAASDLFYLLDDVKSGVHSKAKFEASEEIDFNHPKVQKAFEFLIAAVLDSLKSVGADPIIIENFISDFGLKTVGMEEELKAKMKGVAFSALNPLS